jgi:hypothetical protein
MLTIADLKKILADVPDDATVRAYDGFEGTLIVIERGDETIMSINTDTGEVSYAK